MPYLPVLLSLAWRQGLGLKFCCHSTSEPQQWFREFQKENVATSISSPIRHYHKTLQEQMKGSKCQHPDCKGFQNCKIPKHPQLACLGSPCNPFSVLGAKRFVEGHIKGHRDYSVTFKDALDWVEEFIPVTLVMEQVEGFDRPEAANAQKTPMQRYAADASVARGMEPKKQSS